MEEENLSAAQELSEPQLKPKPALASRQRSFVGGWAIAVVLAVLALLLYEIRTALLPFVFAVAVAFVTDPLIVSVQQRLGSPRWLVATMLYLFILASLGGTAYWIGATAVADLMQVVARAPEILRRFIGEAIGSQGVTFFGQTYTPDELVQALGREVQGIIGLTVVERAAGLAISVLFGTFLTPVLMPYFMISAPRLAAGSIWLLPPERRRSVEDLLPKIVPVLRRYLIGLFLVVVYTSGVGGSALARYSTCPMPSCSRSRSVCSS